MFSYIIEIYERRGCCYYYKRGAPLVTENEKKTIDIKNFDMLDNEIPEEYAIRLNDLVLKISERQKSPEQ